MIGDPPLLSKSLTVSDSVNQTSPKSLTVSDLGHGHWHPVTGDKCGTVVTSPGGNLWISRQQAPHTHMRTHIAHIHTTTCALSTQRTCKHSMLSLKLCVTALLNNTEPWTNGHGSHPPVFAGSTPDCSLAIWLRASPIGGLRT